jgi:hypothetical protein
MRISLKYINLKEVNKMCDTTLAIRGWIERNGKYTPAQVAAKLGYDRKDILILDNDWDSLK